MSPATTLRLGTRGSALALAQAELVARQIEATLGSPVELVTLRARGDDPAVPLGHDPGAFVGTLREALLAGRVDLLVHSLKDLPTEPAAGIVVAAVPRREDPRDVLCARDGLTLDGLPGGASVGTSSPRRRAALERHRPDLRVVGVRGNVDTRLGLVSSGAVDAVVLAAAGLNRLGRGGAITETFDPARMLPAPGQGALAIECRPGALADGLARLDHPPTRLAVTAERAVLRGLDAGCDTAAGALAEWDGTALTLWADLVEGGEWATARIAGSPLDAAAAEDLGRAAAADLRRHPRGL